MAKEYELAVIGGGPGGYVAAIRAAQLGLSVCCIEKESRLGGTCLRVGCIPSKTLLHATHLYHFLHQKGEKFGLHYAELGIDFHRLMERKESVIAGLASGIDGLFKKNKVDRFVGEAHFQSPHELLIRGEGEERIVAKRVILATGSEPIPLPFLPFDERRVLSSTGALSLDAPPKKLLLIGAGVVGLELGSVYRRLGSEVVVIEALDRICPSLDKDLSKALHNRLAKDGLEFHLQCKLIAVDQGTQRMQAKVQDRQGKEELFEADVLLVCIGRGPYTKGLGLEKIGVDVDQRGFVLVDPSFRTSIPHIYAIGDLIGGAMLAHKASEEGVVCVEALMGLESKINYVAVPNVIYTSPEVAGVGLTEGEARAAGLEVKTGAFPFRANSRAHCTGEVDGLVKIIIAEPSERIIGVHIMNDHAGELIGEAVALLEKKATLHDLLSMSHAHPTYGEAIKEAALAVKGKPIHL